MDNHDVAGAPLEPVPLCASPDLVPKFTKEASRIACKTFSVNGIQVQVVDMVCRVFQAMGRPI